MSYCIVIEDEDGTVTVNGPYVDILAANAACPLVAAELARDEEAEVAATVAADPGLDNVGHEEPVICLADSPFAHYRVGEEDLDGIDVYVVAMGTPIGTET